MGQHGNTRDWVGFKENPWTQSPAGKTAAFVAGSELVLTQVSPMSDMARKEGNHLLP